MPVEFRIVADDDARQAREIARADDVIGVRQAGHIAELRRSETDFPRAAVHHLDEGRLGAGDPFREHDARIVRRHDDDALDEILHADARIDVEEHVRAVRHRAMAPGPFGDRKQRIFRDAARLQRLCDDEHRHDLAHRGRRHRRFAILAIEHQARLRVHDRDMAGGTGEAGAHCRGGRGGLRGRDKGRCRHQAKGEEAREPARDHADSRICRGDALGHESGALKARQRVVTTASR